MERKIVNERVKFFCFGVFVVVGILVLTGARDMAPRALNSGRFQISAWAGSFGNNSGGVGVFVVDTISGETKTVYARTYGTPEKGAVLKNDLKKPFVSIK
ncbi:MAG: hypothetical protein ACE5FU_01870 [Nitrospinota bacterium]